MTEKCKSRSAARTIKEEFDAGSEPNGMEQRALSFAERAFEIDEFMFAVADRLATLRVEDETDDWKAVANWLELMALEEGLDLHCRSVTPWEWSFDFV